MIVLDTEDRSLTVVLAGAVNADEPEFVASFVDSKAPDYYEPGAAHGETNGATPVALVAAPSDGRKRQLKYLSIFNADDMAVEVTIGYLDTATTRRIVTITLDVGSTLVYTDGEGFRVIDTDGEILTSTGPGP